MTMIDVPMIEVCGEPNNPSLKRLIGQPRSRITDKLFSEDAVVKTESRDWEQFILYGKKVYVAGPFSDGVICVSHPDAIYCLAICALEDEQR